MVNEVLVLHAALVAATITSAPGGWVLAVRRSVVVRDDDEVYSQVAELLLNHCNELVSRERHRDPAMLTAQADLIVRRVWHACPGVTQPHDCTIALGQAA